VITAGRRGLELRLEVLHEATPVAPSRYAKQMSTVEPTADPVPAEPAPAPSPDPVPPTLPEPGPAVVPEPAPVPSPTRPEQPTPPEPSPAPGLPGAATFVRA
jgi:hypothetical protein